MEYDEVRQQKASYQTDAGGYSLQILGLPKTICIHGASEVHSKNQTSKGTDFTGFIL